MSVLVGRVGLVVKGAWDSSVAYAAMDVVTYNNSTYIAKQAVPAGTLPTNTTYWELSLDASLLQTKADGANKVASAVNGNFAALDANGDLADSGHKHSDYVTDVSGKADKVTGATSGNLAGLDANGNLTDSGVKPGWTSISNETMTSTDVLYTLTSSKKFSDFSMLLFVFWDETSASRNSILIPQTLFSAEEHKVILEGTVAGASYSVIAKRSTDTSYYGKYNGTAPVTPLHMRIYGSLI